MIIQISAGQRPCECQLAVAQPYRPGNPVRTYDLVLFADFLHFLYDSLPIHSIL